MRFNLRSFKIGFSVVGFFKLLKTKRNIVAQRDLKYWKDRKKPLQLEGRGILPELNGKKN